MCLCFFSAEKLRNPTFPGSRPDPALEEILDFIADHDGTLKSGTWGQPANHTS